MPLEGVDFAISAKPERVAVGPYGYKEISLRMTIDCCEEYLWVDHMSYVQADVLPEYALK